MSIPKEDKNTKDEKFVRPTKPEGDLTATSTEADIKAHAKFAAWQAMTGKTDMTDDELAEELLAGEGRLIIEYTSFVKELAEEAAKGQPAVDKDIKPEDLTADKARELTAAAQAEGKGTGSSAPVQGATGVGSSAAIESIGGTAVAGGGGAGGSSTSTGAAGSNGKGPATSPVPKEGQKPKEQKPNDQPVRVHTGVQPPKPSPTPNKPKVEQRQVVAAVKSTNSTLLDRVRVEGSADEKALLSVIDEYCEKMAYRKVINSKDGAMQQRRLYLALFHVLDVKVPTDFKRQWSIALLAFNENSSQNQPFYETMRARFSEEWSWGDNSLSALMNLYNLMALTSDPATRAAGLKRVNLEFALRVGFTEEQRQRLNNFYAGN